jgi:hypothetical protein
MEKRLPVEIRAKNIVPLGFLGKKTAVKKVPARIYPL